jgi:uroporphyrinogen-III decarboxylase
MRQAGRALPEYRALKEKHTFLELVQTPELAAEVTLQPIRRFGFDAAILFCDILVVAEGLGQRYQFRDKGGIEMEFLLNSAADIDRLEVEAVTERLQYVAKALPLIKTALGADRLCRVAVDTGELHDRGRRRQGIHQGQGAVLLRPAALRAITGEAGEGRGRLPPTAN